MLEFTDKEFNKLKEEREAYYKSIGNVSCGYFQGEKIHFNAKGLEHLKFKSKNHARSQQDQYTRLKLLHLAPEILKLSRTVQGICERKVWEINRSNQRNESVYVDAIYYEFIAVIKGIRVRVVVKKIGNTPKYFWSIIPNWKMSENGKRKIHNGNPEED